VIRNLQPELLDELPAEHPGAMQSRRDLRRVNTLMGHPRIITRSLARTFPIRPPSRIVEIGAGDGQLLLRAARRLAPKWTGLDVVFVDQQNLLSDRTKADFAELGWGVRSVEADIFQWLKGTAVEKTDVILANLFLHHFTHAQLSKLFAAAATRCDVFIAVEPRRSAWPLFWTQWLALIGCNAVTCHDAAISVRAGFAGRELSALWPRDGTWKLTERRAGLFSHRFVAQRKT
jgi:SAM-dependent methyltransferase